MFSLAFLFALLAFSITGLPVEVRNSPITLPMTRRLTFSNVTDILRHDEARMAGFMEYSTNGRRASVPLHNMDVGYIVSVNIGWPPVTYNLIVESSCSITWIGAKNPYVSITGVNTNNPVATIYSFGDFQGTMFRDTLALTDELMIHGMPIGVASTSNGINFDGVLGIGPAASSRGALPNSLDVTIPSVTDYLLEQRAIRPVVGISFQPIVQNLVNIGELTFGEADSTKYTGNIKYTDITTIPRSSLYWGINQMITYGLTDLMPRTAGVVDCGTTFIYIASDAYERYKDLTGAIVNRENGCLQISIQQYMILDTLKFSIDDQTYFVLVPNAQIWPRSLNHIMSGDYNDIFLIVKGLPAPSGSGCDFVMGYVFLQRFYTVFDADSSRVGFAVTSFTYENTN